MTFQKQGGLRMKLSNNGYNLIKKYEGCRLKAYKPVQAEKYWTIGWGHYGPDVLEGMTITQQQADEMLVKDMARYENYTNTYCSHLILNQNQFDALVSICYNCGAGNLQKLVKGKTIEQIANAIETFCCYGADGKKLAGLVRRRKEEKELFLTPVKEVKMFNINEEHEALDFLVERGIIDTPDYWHKAIETTYNVDHLMLKFANYVIKMENS